jgi:hypothetical protein
MYEIHKWVGTVLFFLAGVLLSSNIEISKWGFFLFLTGHLIYIYVFYTVRDYPMLVNNCMFACIDLWGIYRWWIA